MPRVPIHFFSEDISYTLKQKLLVRDWINQAILSEGYKLGELTFIFTSDDYLLNINREYLNHDTYTDIITFDNSEVEKEISGDIFISIERVRENSAKFNVSERDELHRVMIHGTLHLLGYPDKGKEAKKVMTAKEDHYLSVRAF
jgi:probable rRNA maturation factor